MVSEKKKDNEKSIRITEEEIKKQFFTNVRGDVMTICVRGSGTPILQSRIVLKCDPILTSKYRMDLARRLLRYMKEAQQDIKNTSMGQ